MPQKKSEKLLPIPLQDRIIISKEKPETKSAGGIFIPEISITESNKGLVVAVGPMVGSKYVTTIASNGLTSPQTNTRNKLQPPRYPAVGDLVLFGDYAGKEFQHDGKEYLIMREADIFCIIPE